ncbi:addiction module antidote protein [Oceaniovalibus sp. ACAM 378]|uniref:addiction module antidote protein n=1 Tax=Oceaniovalibus sp. ACAM 378 TaxID=2599923 RepID=UPI0011D33059|nr:addiction module antidote protein [Oceaniovalibus sp. ACAM 378]TYB85239.1 putative addiction module antidote protein [Oceaniovalibus sp. ACAM 378]
MEDVTFAGYDTADYLEIEADTAVYLKAVKEEGGDNPTYIARALGAVARACNMAALANEVGMSRAELNKVLSGEGNPTLATVMKVTNALGLRFSIQSVV